MEKKKILGLDLGVSSIGWAIIETDENEENPELLPGAMGVRIFSQVTNAKTGDVNNANRREKRGMRRNIERRNRRNAHLLHLLIKNKVLPGFYGDKEGNISFVEDYWNSKKGKELLEPIYIGEGEIKIDTNNILRLRALAVDEKVSLENLGRILYHMCQKRGFQSTSKKELKALKLLEEEDNENSGIVKNTVIEPKEFEKIQKKVAEEKELEFKEMRTWLQYNLGDMTLGQYLYGRFKEGLSIRNLGTDRKMYREEFEKIWSRQAKEYPQVLTEDLKIDIYKAIFDQRPLKSQADKVGECKIFPREKKLAKSHPLAQEFIILGYLNNLTFGNEKRNIHDIFGEKVEQKLKEGVQLFRSKKTDVSRKQIIEWLGIEDENLLNSRKTSWKSDVIFKELSDIFGEELTFWSIEKQNGIIEALKNGDIEIAHNGGKYKDKKGKVLILKGYKDWGIDKKYFLKLDKIDDNDIPFGYIELSQKALEMILPLLRKGIPYKTAEKQLQNEEKIDRKYHNKYEKVMSLRREKWEKGMTKKQLKEIHSNHLPDIANPRVTKTLVELRKLLRAITNKYGSLNIIRIETSRDLKNGKKLRGEIESKQNKNKIYNEQLQREMKEISNNNEAGRKLNTDIHSDDFLRYKLWKELGQYPISLYSGKTISISQLFSGQIEIEHSLPLGTGFIDDSFINKTLCESDINQKKGNKTPMEYFGKDTPEWHAFEKRVKAVFEITVEKNKKNETFLQTKGRRLLMDEVYKEKLLGGFQTRDLNDNSYIAVEAKQFCQALQGEDTSRQEMVQVSKGGITGVLRYNWGWNRFLWPEDAPNEITETKNRGDHRHHSIDAVIIALTDKGIMKRGSDIAKKEIVAHKKIETLKNVWHEVVPGVKAMEKILQKNLEEMNISHANNKKVSGALHKETNYGVRKFDIKGKKGEFNKKVTSRTSLENIYKEVTKWKEDDRTEKAHKFCGNILDPIISKDLNNKISSGTFMLPYLHPVTSKEVKKIRMLEQLLTVDGLMPFGKGLFKNDDNHHIIILERIKEGKGLRNAKGNKAGIVVQLSEAYKQKKNHEPIYNRKGPWEDKKDGDMYTTEEYKFLFSLTKGELVQWEDGKIYQFKGVNVKKQMSFANTTISDEETRTAYPGSLKAQKIQIDALGHIRPAND